MKRFHVEIKNLFIQVSYFMGGEYQHSSTSVDDVSFEAYYDGIRFRVASFDRPCGFGFEEATNKDSFSETDFEKFVRFAVLSYLNGEPLIQTSATTVKLANGEPSSKEFKMPWVMDHRNVTLHVTPISNAISFGELQQVDDTQIDLMVIPAGKDKQLELDFS